MSLYTRPKTHIMRTLIFTFFIAAACFVNAQNQLGQIAGYEFYERYEYYTNRTDLDSETLKENKIQTRVSIDRFKSGSETKTIEKFDTNGKLISRQYFNKKGVLYSDYTYTYNDKKELVGYHYSYGKKSGSARMKYDEAGRLLETRGYTVKGEYFGRTDAYNTNGRVTLTELFRKDSLKSYKRIEYDYYEDQSIKSIRYFEGDKLKYTWSYDCKPEGELVGIKVSDTTHVCIKEEFDEAGNRVRWTQEFNKKGEVEKTMTVYASDSLILSSSRFNNEGQLTSKTTFFKNGGHMYQVYDKNGEVTYTVETIYNDDRQVVKRSNESKKWYSGHWYSYTGDLLATATYMSKNLYYVTEYQYEFYQ